MNRYRIGDVLTRGYFKGVYGEMRIEEITKTHIIVAFYPDGFEMPLERGAPVAIEGLRIEPLNRKVSE